MERNNSISPSEQQRLEFGTDGVVVLRNVFDAVALASEVMGAVAEGSMADDQRSAEASIGFAYVPMMTARTPRSIELLFALRATADLLLDRRTVPIRAKGVRYVGEADWHRDSDFEIPSVGFLAYLSTTQPARGALRVARTSHRSRSVEPVRYATVADLATQPGDIIAMDEGLLHSSVGGDVRYQWRVDFLAVPVSAQERVAARQYVAALLEDSADPPYDVDRYPTFDDRWLARPMDWHKELHALGAYARPRRW